MSIRKKLGYIALFTGTTLGIMHAANRLFNYLSTYENHFGQEEYKYYNWRFGKIAYKKKGSGSPLLLIHNLNVCSSSDEWNRIIDKLSDNYSVYSIDLLGCGCSDRPFFTYTNFLYVQLITDFIKDIIKEKTDVIVSGDSAPAVMMACANDDTIINRVIMINPQNIMKLAKNPTKRSTMVKYLLCAPIIGTFIYNIKINKKTLSDKFRNCYYYNQNNISEHDILTCLESSHRDKAHSKYLYASQKSRYTNANIVCCLDKINNSIFIIVGNENPENALSANQYQNYIPSIEIVGISDTKQLPHIEKPDEFIEQVNILFSDEN